MSRDLIGLAIIAILCIVISPFYKKQEYNKIPKPVLVEINDIQPLDTIKTENTKSIVLLIDSFLPVTFAGSELSYYETIKYLRSRGHTIVIFVNKYKVNEYNGFKIYKYDIDNSFCRSTIAECDIIFFNLPDDPKNFELISIQNKPTFIFIHIVHDYHWVLAHKVKFPLSVIYNSNMTQDKIPTIHDNMRMIPYVNIHKFTPLRSYTIQNNVVCLINCNFHKGGQLLCDLAKSMPDVQFLGVKGAYDKQIIDNSPPPNLAYMNMQSDITVVYKKIGILIMPSTQETWGRTAVEAMAAGVPVIHSDTVGLVECVGGAGIECNVYDQEAWEYAIRRILGDPAYREHLRQNGFKRVKDIDIEQRRGRQELAIKIERDM